ncbi:hypothetical protein [Thermopirellula anaerolimosa]
MEFSLFDDVRGIAVQCAEEFCSGVRDAFGASMIRDILDPILKEIDALRTFNEEFQRHSVSIATLLEEARSIRVT